MVGQLLLLAGFDLRRELRRAVIVQFRIEPAAEDHLAGEGPADLHLDGLVAVIADALDPFMVIVPPGDLVVDLDAMPLVRTVIDVDVAAMEPEGIAPTPQANVLVDHLGIATQVEHDFLADGHVLDMLPHQEGQPVASVVAVQLHDAVRQRRGTQPAGLVISQQEQAHHLVTVFGHAVTVLDAKRDLNTLERAQALGPGVLDRFGTLDGVNEILR